MEEVEYLRTGNTLVTTTRIEIKGQTFAVRNIGSVKVTKPGMPFLASLIGVLAAIWTLGSQNWWGLLVVAACAAWVWQQVRTRRLVLVSGGGETVALTSTEPAAVEVLRDAIAKAISAR